jgi:hypothetical protein
MVRFHECASLNISAKDMITYADLTCVLGYTAGEVRVNVVARRICIEAITDVALLVVGQVTGKGVHG